MKLVAIQSKVEKVSAMPTDYVVDACENLSQVGSVKSSTFEQYIIYLLLFIIAI